MTLRLLACTSPPPDSADTGHATYTPRTRGTDVHRRGNRADGFADLCAALKGGCP